MNVLPQSKQAAILRALTEGTSVRAAARMVGVSKTTVLRLLCEVGEICQHYQHFKLRNLPCDRIEADEIWGFVYAKQKHATIRGQGDVWTFTALDPDTKLMVSWLVATRTPEACDMFVRDLASRLSKRIQLTTDGLHFYLRAVEGAFGWNGCDFAQLIKKYGSDPDSTDARRYSPPICIGTIKQPVMGAPVEELVSTSMVERSNLTLRMQNRRMTRLTNAFSRTVTNHAHSIALHFMVYNFCKAHGTLTKAASGIRTSPAMAAGLTDHVWQVEEILELMNPNKPIG